MAADDAAALRRTVDSVIQPLMAEYGVAGMAVAVTVDGQANYFNYGVGSTENNTPVSESTLFEIGSVSKTFTATLATYAETLGKLSLDDHPGKFMPRLRGHAIDRASLLQLGTYTAGELPLQFPDAVTTAEQMVGYFQHWRPRARAGARRLYSNPSIGLLGHVAALALNSDFADAAENTLFPLLGLHHSFIRVPANAMADYAWGYDRQNRPTRVHPGVFDAEAYGVKSSAADMLRFLQDNISPDTLAAPMRRAVKATQKPYYRVGPMLQGLGWEQYPFPVTLERLLAGNTDSMIFDANAALRILPAQQPTGPTLFDKTGSTDGFGAYVAFVPAQRIGIVMLSNRNFSIPARVKAAHAILRQLSVMAR